MNGLILLVANLQDCPEHAGSAQNLMNLGLYMPALMSGRQGAQ